MKKLKQIYINNNETKNNIFIEELKNIQNNENFNKANQLLVSLEKLNDYSTEFESVDGFIAEGDEDVSAIYKHWIIEIYTNENLENILDFILPFIKYEIIYKEPASNNINFYNTHDNLHMSSFYEIQENLLILHISFNIIKNFNGETLNIPEAKVHINFQNPLNINQ